MPSDSTAFFQTRFAPLTQVVDGLSLTSPEQETLVQFACRFDGLHDLGSLDAVADTLDPELAQYVANVSHKRKMEFLAGRYCALRALESVGAKSECWVGRSPEGMPLWPAGWVGSISHTSGLATAVAAPRRDFEGLGVDVERAMSAERSDRLAEKIVAGYPLPKIELAKPLLITLVFSVKEALYKALNPIGRLSGGFDSADIVDWDFARGRCLVRLRDKAVLRPKTARDYVARFVLCADETAALIAVSPNHSRDA